MSSKRFETLSDWLQWQESAAPSEIELGLERCLEIAKRLDIHVKDAVVLTVAGTNGKGSTVAMLEQTWLAAGYHVAAYTSPHMIAYNERIRFNGTPATSAEICAAFEKIERVRGDIYLTYFEYGTLAALTIFQTLEPDVVILEVGLGGRLDAVNIVNPDVALITSIGIDHVEFLGEDRESIGYEKAGIMRAEVPAICSDPHVPHSIVQYANEISAKLALLGVDFRFSEKAQTWDWWCGDSELLDLPKPNLVGQYQFRNAAGVLQAIELLQQRLPVSRKAIEQMLKNITLWGRFQRFRGDVDYVLDVAHNAQAIEQFVATLADLECHGRTHLVLGMLKAKDRASVIRLLNESVDYWYLASVNARRGASSAELFESLKEVASKARVDQFSAVEDALLAAASRAEKGDRIIALGSFLVVSEALRFLQEQGIHLAIPSLHDSQAASGMAQ